MHGWKGRDSRFVAKATSNVYNEMRALFSYLIETAPPLMGPMKMAEVSYDMSSNRIQPLYSLLILTSNGAD
jgi:hypothetical protein